MKWTTSPPTKPGWYWAREDANARIEIAYVVPGPSDLRVWGHSWIRAGVVEDFALWSDSPIPEPEGEVG